MTFDYFAYGSNLHPLRLAARTPSCRALGPARLAGHKLRFHKRSLAAGDDSGKCDAYATGDPVDVVHGVVYRIDLRDLPALDAAEGNGDGYQRVTARVVGAAGAVAAETYLASPAWIDRGLRPYDWYLEFVVRGAGHHALPPAYRAALARTPAVPDPDRARAAQHFALARGALP
jgi:hypothetical protein